jgi:hypothetical protein
MKRILTSFLAVLVVTSLANAQTKAMSGTVITTVVGAQWSGIVIQVANKKYGVQTSYEPSAGDEARGERGWHARTVGNVNEGHRVEVYYTKMDCSHAYEEGVPCWLTATRVVELKQSPVASSTPSSLAPTRAPSKENRDWDKFWNRFSAAVRNKNRAAIKSMASSHFDWIAIDNSIGAWIRNLDRNNLWYLVQNSLSKGTMSLDSVDGKPSRCTRDGHLNFVFENGTWRFSGIGGV